MVTEANGFDSGMRSREHLRLRERSAVTGLSSRTAETISPEQRDNATVFVYLRVKQNSRKQVVESQ